MPIILDDAVATLSNRAVVAVFAIALAALLCIAGPYNIIQNWDYVAVVEGFHNGKVCNCVWLKGHCVYVCIEMCVCNRVCGWVMGWGTGQGGGCSRCVLD